MDRPSPLDTCPAQLTQLVEKALGRQIASVDHVPPGLDSRRFYRLGLAGKALPSTLIARVDPNPGAGSDLEPIRALFARHDLPVPGHLASARGIELLEDLGDESLEQLAHRRPAERRDELYAEACDLVPRIQSIPAPDQRGWDANLVADKARKWVDWTLPFALGRPARASEREVVEKSFAFIAETCLRAAQRLAHRDFKAANLLLAPAAAQESRRLSMIDLQGAFLAPPEYDLACLLRDSQVPLPESAVRAQLDRIRPALPDAPPPDEFDRRFDMVTVTRVAKDISHYLRAATERGDRRYLAFVATGLENLRAATRRAAQRDPQLGAWAQLIEGLPGEIRVPPDRFPETPS